MKNKKTNDRKGCIFLVIIIFLAVGLLYSLSTCSATISIPSFLPFSGDGPGIKLPFINSEAGRNERFNNEAAGGSGGSGANARDGGVADAVDGSGADAMDDAGAAGEDGSDVMGGGDSDISSAGATVETLWREYQELLAKHEEMIIAVNGYSGGAVGLDELKENVGGLSSFFDEAVSRLSRLYRTPDAPQPYLDILLAAAMSDQIAAAYIKNCAEADIAFELRDPGSGYNRNASDAKAAYSAFSQLDRDGA